MIIIYLYLIIFYISMIFIVANLGYKKEIGSTKAGLISLFFSPIIGLLVVIASPLNFQEVLWRKELDSIIRLEEQAIVLMAENNYIKAEHCIKAALDTVKVSKNKLINNKYHIYLDALLFQIKK